METEEEKELFEFIVLNLGNAEYSLTYENGSEWVCINIEKEAAGQYFRVNAIDEKSTRAHYKLSPDAPEKTVVVELSECRDKSCLMTIKRIHITFSVGLK